MAERAPIDFFRGQPYPEWDEARRSECPVIAQRGGRRTTRAPRSRSRATPTPSTSCATVRRSRRRSTPSTSGSSWATSSSRWTAPSTGSTATSSPRRSARRSSSSGTRRSCGPMINRLLDTIAPLGRADLVRDVTSQYPVQVICGIAGVPLEDAAQFHAVGGEDQHRAAEPGGGARGVERDGRVPASARRSPAGRSDR